LISGIFSLRVDANDSSPSALTFFTLSLVDWLGYMALGITTNWRNRSAMSVRSENVLWASLRKGARKVLCKRSVGIPSDEAFSAQIISQMDSAAIAIDIDAVTTLVNPTAARLFNADDVDLIGKPINQLIPESMLASLLHTLATQQPCQRRGMTLHLTCGRVLPTAYSTALLHAKSGRLSGALLMIYDLSSVIEAEAEKHRTERLASMQALVCGIAHEIKNPLVAIKALAELLPEQYDDAEFRERFSQVALYEVERMDALVQRLQHLDMAPPSRMCRISILAPLDEILALLSGELTSRRMTLSFKNDRSLPLILGDHDQLKQVFLNLCLNSIEAMQEGGTLSIYLSTEAAHDTQGEMLLVCIADTGAGLSHVDLNQIFDPFVTTKKHGSGLGLAICKAIILHHGGTINAVNGGHGCGARFFVRLPIVHQEDAYEVDTPRCRSARTADAIR
jgi:two-component system sensor histidine kinase HydH